jgi:hypothetical protein
MVLAHYGFETNGRGALKSVPYGDSLSIAAMRRRTVGEIIPVGGILDREDAGAGPVRVGMRHTIVG